MSFASYVARSSSAFSDNSSKRAASSSVSSTPSNSLSLSASYSLPHGRLDQSLFFRASPFGSISKSSTSYLHFPSAPRSQPVACLIFLAFSFSFVWRRETNFLSLILEIGAVCISPLFVGRFRSSVPASGVEDNSVEEEGFIRASSFMSLPFSMCVSLWS